MISLSYCYQGIIVPASTLIPIVLFLRKYRQLSRQDKIILYYLIFAIVINVLSSVLASYGINNLPLLHLFTIFEFVLLISYFYTAVNHSVYRKILFILLIAFPAFCVVNLLYIQNIYSFNTYTRPVEAIIIICCSGWYLFQQAKKSLVTFFNNSETWILCGLLLYFCSSLFQFVFSNLISYYADHYTKMIIWNIHATLVMLMYFFFSQGSQHESVK